VAKGWKCGRCLTVNGATAKFCTGCGESVAHSQSRDGADETHPPPTASSDPTNDLARGENPSRLRSDHPTPLRRTRSTAATVRRGVAAALAVGVVIVLVILIIPLAARSDGRAASSPVSSTTSTSKADGTSQGTPNPTSLGGEQPGTLIGSDTSNRTPMGGPTDTPLWGEADVPLPAGFAVTVFCASYGATASGVGRSSGLWYATNIGWFGSGTIQILDSGHTPEACTGSVADPVAGSDPPSRSAGPYPVVADQPGAVSSVVVRASPASDSPEVAALDDGALVTLVCSVHAQFVPAPQRIEGEGSNDQWDKVASPSGWIPDSWVDSQTSGSAAPPC
jgi:hypothetical protein